MSITPDVFKKEISGAVIFLIVPVGGNGFGYRREIGMEQVGLVLVIILLLYLAGASGVPAVTFPGKVPRFS